MDPMDRKHDLTDDDLWRAYRPEIFNALTKIDWEPGDEIPDDNVFWDWLICLRMMHLQEMPYSRYLKSPEWEQTREAVKERDGGRCRLCDATSALQVHHRTYERRGVERLDDLTLLCGDCHSAFHGKG